MRKWILGLLAFVAIAAIGLYVAAFEAMGDRPQGARLERMKASGQWRDGAFDNRLPRVDGAYADMLREWIFGGSKHRLPAQPISVETRTAADYDMPPSTGLRATWLGHSTMLLEIDGQRVLIDPVWGERASPLSFMGPKRFYAPPLPLAELPDVQTILISHDHYDHLDHPTVELLASRDVRWLVPLGIGAHLEYWGVSADRIEEFDWWEHTKVGPLEFTATPSRHFSGRGLTDANRTLWTGWAIRGPKHNVYYSGDTSMFPGFLEIGERLGPFDLTMIEVGAYDALWSDVHLGPEQGVRAHQLVRGRTMLPVHWGLFDLALHGWTEPIERVRVAAERAGVVVTMPRPGGRVEPTAPDEFVAWWPDVPWQTVETAPAPSSGVAELNGSTYAAPERCSEAARLAFGGTWHKAEDGTKVWYRVAGKDGAPTLVYLHGGPGSSSLTFERTAGRLLERDFKVIYIDQRGAGRSGFEGPSERFAMARTIEDIDAIRAAVDAERVVLVGHSFGGIVAAAYALEHPDHVAGTVMVDTTPYVGDALAHQIRTIARADTFAARAEDLRVIAGEDSTTLVRLGKMYDHLGRQPLQARLHFARPEAQRHMEWMERLAKGALCTSPQLVQRLAADGYFDPTVAAVAESVPGPVLHVAGTKSEVIGRANIERGAATWGGEIVWVDDAGHFVYFEAPEQFAELVTKFTR